MVKNGKTKRKLLAVDSLSGRVLALLVAVSAVLFGAFFIIGYDIPYAEDASFNAPLLTDTLLIYIYVMCGLTVVVAVVAMVRGALMYGGRRYETNGVPSGRIVRGVALLLVVTLVVTYALGSSEPLIVNGKVYAESGWLKLTDMFINTSAVLGVVAVAIVVYGVSGLNRKNNRKTV